MEGLGLVLGLVLGQVQVLDLGLDLGLGLGLVLGQVQVLGLGRVLGLVLGLVKIKKGRKMEKELKIAIPIYGTPTEKNEMEKIIKKINLKRSAGERKIKLSSFVWTAALEKAEKYKVEKENNATKN